MLNVIKSKIPLRIKKIIKYNVKNYWKYLEFFFSPFKFFKFFKIYRRAISIGFFDPLYYSNFSIGNKATDFELFLEYLEVSKFSNVNPSLKFDGEKYLKMYPDVYYAGQSPLYHFLTNGRREGRSCQMVSHAWTPDVKSILEPCLMTGALNYKVAIVLHIFYDDFIDKFSNYLKDFPVSFDLIISHAEGIKERQILLGFSKTKIKKLIKLKCYKAHNKGRNFGQFLTEIAPTLYSYDYVCHAHSKKSLYSGREQTQWADYNFYYLFGTKYIVSSILNLFSNDEKLGIYYPTSFWMMPSWVNNWTCNKELTKSFFSDIDSGFESNFLNYPVGGMFWFRPKALSYLLDYKLTLDDFPDEPISADGTILHGIERLIGIVVKNSGYSQFFYHASTGNFTVDGSYIFSQYNRTAESVYRDCLSFQIISFDLFDTLVQRDFYYPDYAKFLSGIYFFKKKLVRSPDDFVNIRNRCELDARVRKNFHGDVSLREIYEIIQERHPKFSDIEIEELCEIEFNYDLEMIQPKSYMLNIFNLLIDAGRKVCITTDTYYSKDQIKLLLRKCGILRYDSLFVSSDLSKRKDTGAMWPHLISHFDSASISEIVHLGDNVHSDSQVPGDMGITTIHILNPLDKWYAVGLDRVFDGQFSYVDRDRKIISEKNILKWGMLINAVGSNPLLCQEGV